MTDPNQIAKSLTPAQKRAFMLMPTERPFFPLVYAKQLPTIACIRSKRLIRTVKDGINPWDESIVTRPLGLAVRAIIERDSNGK